MKTHSELSLMLKEMAPDLQYVFTKKDLAHLFGNEDNATFNARVRHLIDRGYLFRAMRGYFYTADASLDDLALRIYPEGYLSLGTALSYHQMIGTVPAWVSSIVTTRAKGKLIKTGIGTVSMSCHNVEHHVGIVSLDGRRYADKEKAFIDTCYFYTHGNKLPFNLTTDIDQSSLRFDVIENYLQTYKNPKFITFVRGLLDRNG